MDVVATLRDRVLMIGAVTALASTRVYASHLPQSPTFPAVLLERVDEVQHSQLRGGSTLRMTRVQVTSIATNRAQAVALDAAVDGDGAGSGVSYWTGTMGSPSVDVRVCEPAGVREMYDPGVLRQYRILRDFRVHHR